MLLEVHDHLGNPVKIRATRVLICLDDGTPVAFSLEFQPGHIRHFRAGVDTEGVHHFRGGDRDFNEQLRMHGIKRTVVCTTLDPKTLTEQGS